jgi:hypothetical protein
LSVIHFVQGNNSTPDEDRKWYPSKTQSDTIDSMANSAEAQQITVDAETLVAQTQERMWRALKRRYQYDSNLNSAQTFLLNHVNSKIPLVIMYVDLVGSTNMSMTLPVDKPVTTIRAFTYKISSVITVTTGIC